ncbi:MAG TPA: hypothetical protein PK079_23595 [Leptospiraceae bacterium]|nr:hypothetical protein [Leptospiraceae bacterium]HMW03649.1 hypothetical protein [Leptospiraceae bacterium]HMX31224.1 hypothetical protein [Leptospiraceae bacterium]HMY29430.1 hypothetical protein [Leptospiraceae bacterium]HMZ65840.1 hypothetical protein [Leptospiraceae bacterium]
MTSKKKKSLPKEKPNLFEKSIQSFTILGPVENSNIRKIESEEGLPFHLIVAFQKAKAESTKGANLKSNSIDHSVFAVYATSRSKHPSHYIVMGSVAGVNYTYVNLIGVSPDGKKIGKSQMVGD